jgi:DNA ligase 1
MVFDLPAHPSPIGARVMRMRVLLNNTGILWLPPATQFWLDDAAELNAWLDKIIAAGDEGLILHHRKSSRHRLSCSKDLLKYKPYYKPYDDAEARVVGQRSARASMTAW